jgi:hypothetical protein
VVEYFSSMSEALSFISSTKKKLFYFLFIFPSCYCMIGKSVP